MRCSRLSWANTTAIMGRAETAELWQDAAELYGDVDYSETGNRNEYNYLRDVGKSPDGVSMSRSVSSMGDTRTNMIAKAAKEVAWRATVVLTKG